MTINKRNRIVNEAIKSLQDSNYERKEGLVTARAGGFEATGVSGLEATKTLLDKIECEEYIAKQIRKYGSSSGGAALSGL
jgi:hypothetical protein